MNLYSGSIITGIFGFAFAYILKKKLNKKELVFFLIGSSLLFIMGVAGIVVHNL